jgi:hypothetical protein
MRSGSSAFSTRRAPPRRARQTDEAIASWLAARVSADKVRAANDWLTGPKSANLDRQDREEGAA